MQTLEGLGAPDLVAVLTAYRDALRAHQGRLNQLNVYPVPDGDTGTNMALTLEAVVAEIQASPSGDLGAVAAALSHGSLMGARGNSGVILSQVLRGLAEAVREGDRIDAEVVTTALARAADGAYRAVMHPVEGTMLSVARAAATAASQTGITGGGHDELVAVLDAARAGAAAALARTPEQLPVLAQAGVVDAGGAGFCLLLDAFLAVVAGRELPVPEAVAVRPSSQVTADPAGSGPAGTGEDGVGDLRYEVMYLLEAPDDTIPAFRDVWAGVGGSIVVVGGDGLWNCHIHTDDIGAAVEAALDVGRPRRIRVTDLREQVELLEEERWVREAPSTPEPSPELTGPPATCEVVAVCTGEGLKRIFHSLGVHQLVEGGQSMNPSTADLLAAVDACRADQVVVLPNNKNIVPVARQAAAATAKDVDVVPTPGVPEGFGALLAFDPQGDLETNVKAMKAAAAHVVAGEVTHAVRDAQCDVGPIRQGDYLGLSRRRIEAVEPTLARAATALLAVLLGGGEDNLEVVTIIEGEGATAADTRRITEWLAGNHPELGAEVHHGGQPLYPYLFSIE